MPSIQAQEASAGAAASGSSSSKKHKKKHKKHSKELTEEEIRASREQRLQEQSGNINYLKDVPR